MEHQEYQDEEEQVSEAHTTPPALTDRQMTKEELQVMPLEKQEAYLRTIIEQCEPNNIPVSKEMREQLRDTQVQKRFTAYLLSAQTPEERKHRIDESRTKGFPDEILATLTPPDDFFIESNETRQ